jgi:putative membrane protein
MQSLQNLTGSEFDQKFVQKVIEHHQKNIASFERASKECQDTDVKAFADKTLPTLRTHLQTAQAAIPNRSQAR